jgi:ABC-type phosphate transport system substrate-binding protein
MRVVSKFVVVAAAAATVLGVGLGPALADPPAGTTPALPAVVGVGAQTTQGLMDAIAHNWSLVEHESPQLWSWDAVNPTTGAAGDTIITKAKGGNPSDTTCSIARPNGTGAGVTALATTVKDSGHPCIDYARASSPPSATSPSGLVWVDFGQDVVTWATPNPSTGEPNTLTAAQLNAIYSCTDTTWNQVGGTSTATIEPALPQTSSGTRTFFLAAIGNPTLGSCVTNGTYALPNGTVEDLEENTGKSETTGGAQCTSADWNSCTTANGYFFATNPNAIYPYSAADWIAQEAAPAGGGHANPGFGPGVLRRPQSISGIAPITNGSPDTISTTFTTNATTKIFERDVYNVVPNVGTTSAPAIASGAITTFFGPTGVVCSDTTQIKSWGFLPLGSACGSLTAG